MTPTVIADLGGKTRTRVNYDYSALAYATYLARYIRDPSTIRARTIDHFGYAPSREKIASLITRARAENDDLTEHYTGDRDNVEDDGRPFKVRAVPMPEPEPSKPAPIIVHTPLGRPVEIVTPSDIIAAIAFEMNVGVKDVLGGTRLKPIMLARRTAAYVLNKRGNSTKLVGRWLGVDHSSVIHAVREFERRATPEMWAIAERYMPKPAECEADDCEVAA